MSKTEIFNTIKLANALVDAMASYPVNSQDYTEINEDLGYTLAPLMGEKRRNFQLCRSEPTGHYFVKFS